MELDLKQGDDGNGSDEDQMVICEEISSSDIDFKFKNESLNRDHDTYHNEGKCFNLSPDCICMQKGENTCRPKPIKGNSYFYITEKKARFIFIYISDA